MQDVKKKSFGPIKSWGYAGNKKKANGEIDELIKEMEELKQPVPHRIRCTCVINIHFYTQANKVAEI